MNDHSSTIKCPRSDHRSVAAKNPWLSPITQMKKTTQPIMRDASDLITLRVLSIKSKLPVKVLNELLEAGKIPAIRISESVVRFDWPSVKSALSLFETQGVSAK